MPMQERRTSRRITPAVIITALTVWALIDAAPAVAQEIPQLPIGILDGSRVPRQRPRPRPMRELVAQDAPAWEVGIQGGLWDLADRIWRWRSPSTLQRVGDRSFAYGAST